MEILHEFLESSTIHGVNYIVTAKVSFYIKSPFYFLHQTTLAKILWTFIVSVGFIGAGLLIGNAYKEWQGNPIATSITTHPIEGLDFPNVTICPPRDSNTALYYDLVKAGNVTLSDKDRITLKETATEIFLVRSHMEYVKKMSMMSRMGNMDQVLQGFHSLPNPYHHGFQIKMWNQNGTITTPWYKGDYVEEYYKDDREYHMELEFPEDIKEQVGDGSLKVQIEVDTREEQEWNEEVSFIVYTLHTSKKEWQEADDVCQREGGQLISVISEPVDEIVKKLARLTTTTTWYIWLGGRKKYGHWMWSDNSTWGFTNWHMGQQVGDDCCVYSLSDEKWFDETCTESHKFICQRKRVLKGQKMINMSFSKDELDLTSFNVWYKFKAASQMSLHRWKDKRMTGLRFSWAMPTLVWTTNITEIGRSIKTPLHGDTFAEAADYVCKAILAPSKDSVAEMGGENLLIELDLDLRQSDKMSAFTGYKLSRKKQILA